MENFVDNNGAVSAKEMYKQLKSKRVFGKVINENAGQSTPKASLEKAFSNISLQSTSPVSEIANFPFRIFSRQQNAIESVSEDCSVFSMEVSECGARRYFQADPRQFWANCVVPNVSSGAPMHFYEVLLPTRPVRLYMDLDLKNPSTNFTFSEVQLAEIINSVVFHSLIEEANCCHFSVALPEKDFGLKNLRLVVQSATDRPRKISLHLIWPDVWFSSNKTAGEFVRRLHDKVKSHCGQEESQAPSSCKSECTCSLKASECNRDCNDASFTLASSCLFYRHAKSGASDWSENSPRQLIEQQFLIDLGVYDRNRNWRLWRSAKRAGGLRFKLFKLFGFSKSTTALTEEQVFLDSLVCPPPKMLAKIKASQSLVWLSAGHGNSNSSPSSDLSSFSYGQGPSPFPDVDDFLCNEILAPNAPPGLPIDSQQLIRSWRYFPSSASITYDISNQYRFCARINRPHRSNRIYFTVSLKSGEIFQRCYDSDCKSFRSFPPWLLPRHLLQCF